MLAGGLSYNWGNPSAYSGFSLVARSSLFAEIGAKSRSSIASSPQVPLRTPLNKEIKKCTY